MWTGVETMIGMAGYTKLFNSILASSVWQETLSTKVLWITLLAMADKDGIAEASLPGLAKIAGISIAETEAGIKSLMSPDKYSRTKDFDGRRIEEIDGGWKVLNHPKYRSKMSVDERREYKRLKQQEYRAAEKSTKSTRGQSGHNAKAYTEAKAEASNERGVARAIPKPLTDAQVDQLDADIAFEERRFNTLALPIRDSIQAVLDSLPRPASRSPFSASRWLRTGLTGIGRSESALTVLRLTNDALEARQRGNGAGRKSKAQPWDRPDMSQSEIDAEAEKWIADNAEHPFLQRCDIELFAVETPQKIRSAVTMILFARNPHLRGPAETRQEIPS